MNPRTTTKREKEANKTIVDIKWNTKTYSI